MANVNNAKNDCKETKRQKVDKTKQKIDENSEIVKTFRGFQEELDLKHDKHERLVKLSRDVTIESKRTIFLLHRCVGSQDQTQILEEAHNKIIDIQQNKLKVMAEELKNEDPNLFMRAVSPGLQEYIEAISFFNYLQNGQLVRLHEVQKDLNFSSLNTNEITSLDVPAVEYLLGIADLTGELMRLAINNVAAGNLDLPYKICEFLQIIQDGYSLYGNTVKELNRKMTTLRQSLKKVEKACYTLHVRGSEIPKHMLADVFMNTDDHYAEDID